MLGIVLPIALAGSLVAKFPFVFIAVDVPVTVNIPVDIDIDIPSVPVGVPPRITPCGTHGDTRCKGKRGSSCHVSRRIIVVGRIRRIPPRPIDHGGIINRHVDNLWIGRLDLNDRLLDDDNLLFRRLEVTLCLGFCAKPLDGIQDIFLLREEGIAQFLCPIEFLAHHVEDLRKIHQGLHTGVPILLL